MATLYSSGASTPDATESTAGKLRIATNAEATAGTNDTTAMTPLKVAAAISAGSGGVTGALVYRGSYDASTASPDLTTASKGDFYLVSVAGALDGVALNIGDHVVFNQNAADPVTSAMFDKIDSTDAVSSVNGQTGVITLTASDVNALASGDNVSALTNDAGYITSAPVNSVNSLTGAVTLSANDLAADHTANSYTPTNANIDGHLNGIDTALASVSGGLSSVAADTTPQLGGPLDVNGEIITSASNGDITLDPDGNGDIVIGADIMPDATDTHEIGSTLVRFDVTHSDIEGAQIFRVRNNTGATLNKGEAVYISGVNGNYPEVSLAQANSASTMPAYGLVKKDISNGSTGYITTFGNLRDHDTSAFSLGDTLFISATNAGAVISTAPTGESNLVQNIGRVVKSHATSGIIKVGGAGRSAATPNLDQNKIFLGDSNNRAVSTALSAVALSSFNNDLGLATVATSGAYSDLSGTPTLGTAAALDTGTSASNVVQLDGSARLPAIDGSQLTNLPSASAASETVAGVIEIATNAEATAATATDKAIVPSNLSSVNVSTLNNDAGYLTSAPVTSVNTQTGAVTLTASDVGALANLSEDTSPQLGNDLDLNGNDLVTTSNVNIGLAPNGVGYVEIKGNTNPGAIQLNCENNSHGVQIQSPEHSASASYNLILPTGVGTDGQVLKTDGGDGGTPATVQLTWVDQASGGSAPSVTSASPSANYAITTYTGLEEIYILTPSADIDVTLPAASSAGSGYKYNIKNLSTNTITLKGATGDNIDGVAPASGVPISTQYESLTVVTDGSNWFII